MSRICDIYDIIDAVAPFSSQLSFDNSGLIVGDRATVVTRALICLDITQAVVEEAAKINANLIISHHPVIFTPVKSFSGRDIAYQLAKRDIAALCCHTNLDISPICGVNIALGSRLGLRNLRTEDVFDKDCVLFSGELDHELSPLQLAEQVKSRLGAEYVQLIDAGRPVKKVFICSGSGGDFTEFAALRGGEAYVTGEMHHHEALNAANTGITCVIAGHYETEVVFADFLAAYLKKRLPDTAFLVSKAQSHPFISI